MSEVELTPEAALAELERQAVAGEAVTTAELVEARERVSLAGLVRQGIAARAEVKRQAVAAEVREAAKLEAAKLFAGREGDSDAAFEAAIGALERLVAVIEASNARIPEAEGILRRGGVPVQYSNREYAPEIDMQNYASMDDGLAVKFVMVDGKVHGRESASLRVAAAVEQVARAHDGLPLPGGSKLESKITFR